MLMRDQHLYKSSAIEVYGHCRLRTITLTEGARLIFLAIQAWKIAGMAGDLNSQP